MIRKIGLFLGLFFIVAVGDVFAGWSCKGGYWRSNDYVCIDGGEKLKAGGEHNCCTFGDWDCDNSAQLSYTPCSSKYTEDTCIPTSSTQGDASCGAYGYSMGPLVIPINCSSCNWSCTVTTCGSYGACRVDGTRCRKYGIDDCGETCYTDCTPAEVGCAEEDCPTTCGYPGGQVKDGTFSTGCTCDYKTCPATAACCTASNPAAPTLLTPANGTKYAVGAVVPLSWSMGLWGTGCPANNNSFTLCVSSDQTSCDLYNGNLGTLTSHNLTVSNPDDYITWQVTASNGSNQTGSAVGNFRVNSAPTVSGIVMMNSAGVVVPVEAGNRNHLCQTTFTGSASPRTVRFSVGATDVDGGADISAMTLTWNGRSYPMTLQAASGNYRTGTASVTFVAGDNGGGTYGVGVTVVDASEQTAQITPRSFKVWDCNVPVSGNLYDGSAGQACNTTGFSLVDDGSMNFNALVFDDMSGSSDVTMTVNTANSYGPNSVLWYKSYLPLFNGGSVINPNGALNASGRMTRSIDLSVGTTTCPTSTQFDIDDLVSAYANSPALKVDFSFIRNQEPWFQVWGGDIRSGDELVLGVPIMATSPYLSINDNYYGSNNNGLISYVTSIANSNGDNDFSAIATPNNWLTQRKVLGSEKYFYSRLYNDYYLRLGEGVTLATSANLASGSTGVYFINGDYTINNDMVVSSSRFLMLVSSGKVSIGTGVTRFDGVIVADDGIEIGGSSDNQLTVYGSLYSANGDIRINRGFTNAADNNTTPAVRVRYRPLFLFTMPPKLSNILSGWKEN